MKWIRKLFCVDYVTYKERNLLPTTLLAGKSKVKELIAVKDFPALPSYCTQQIDHRGLNTE